MKNIFSVLKTLSLVFLCFSLAFCTPQVKKSPKFDVEEAGLTYFLNTFFTAKPLKTNCSQVLVLANQGCLACVNKAKDLAPLLVNQGFFIIADQNLGLKKNPNVLICDSTIALPEYSFVDAVNPSIIQLKQGKIVDIVPITMANEHYLSEIDTFFKACP
jgi:hypothetical protein